MSIALRFKLSLMMFLQFMLVAVFFPQLAAYLGNLKVNEFMFATIMATMALGAIISPIVGMVADRFLNGEKVLFLLNIAVAVFLVLAALTTNHVMLFIWLLLAMFAYMPTWGLTSSIAITNSTPEAFPMIRVFGSIGWVCAAGFALGAKFFFDTSIDGTETPLLCGAAVSVVAAVLALLLPATPPSAKGQPLSVVDALGLRAFSMLKDRNTAIFMICSAAWMFTFVIYWLFFSEFLLFLNVKDITVTMSIGQISEMFFIAMLPFAIKIFGLKNTMALGILAMVVRYLFCAFSSADNGLFFGAIAVHGIIFGFFFVSAQMYIAKKAPASLQAQAQGLFFCLAFGAAQIVGSYFTRWLISANSVEVARAQVVEATATTVTAATEVISKIDWQSVFLIEAGLSGALLVFFFLFFKDDTKKA